jgi:hypothetical protein
MATIPGWVRVSNMRESGDRTVSFDVQVRVWHLGFIRHALGEIRDHVELRLTLAGRSVRIPWVITAPVLVPWLMWQLRAALSHTKATVR